AIKAKQELALRADPELGPLIVASEILGNNSPAILAKVTNATNKFFGQNSMPYDEASDTNAKPADVVGAPDGDVKSYLDLTKVGAQKALEAPTPALVQETGTHI